MAVPAIFFDKDGTLVTDVPYNVDPARLSFFPSASEAVKVLSRLGYEMLVASNQPGVALGYFDESQFLPIRNALETWFLANGSALKGFLYCPHHPHGVVPGYRKVCSCRKPKPGLLQSAAREFDIDLGRSWFMGDILDDIEAGNAAGCRTILIDNGHETEWKTSPVRTPDWIAADLAEAARFIVTETIRLPAIEDRLFSGEAYR